MLNAGAEWPIRRDFHRGENHYASLLRGFRCEGKGVGGVLEAIGDFI